MFEAFTTHMFGLLPRFGVRIVFREGQVYLT
jgi:hypothetical protein